MDVLTNMSDGTHLTAHTCQMITDTKAEFVGHIKAEHRNVVDEDVLRSLEADIRKSKKKQGHSKRPKKMLKLHLKILLEALSKASKLMDPAWIFKVQ